MLNRIFLKKTTLIVLVIMFICSSTFAFAADIENTGDESKKLEKYLTELVVLMNSKKLELSDINQKMTEIDDNIEKNTGLLERTEEASEIQRESMKKRIKYLYESAGDMSVIEAVLSAESIGDAINRTSYVSKIIDYDRQMLNQYESTINNIISLKEKLEDSRAALSSLLDEYSEKGTEFSAMVTAVPGQMAGFGIEEEDVSSVIEDFIDENPELLKNNEEINGNTDANSADDTSEKNISIETMTETTQNKSSEETETVQINKEETTVKEDAVTEAFEKETTTAKEEASTQTSQNLNDDPIWNLARITYLENGVMYPESSYESIYLTACVVINRANAWFGGSIMDSIYAPGAYATAYKYDSWGGGELVINDITWQAVNDALANTDPNPFYQANGSWLESYGLREYYRDPVTDEVFYYAN